MLAVILLVDRFERLNQWGPGDLYFFFGMMSVTFYLTECFGRGITGNFPYLIRTGQLDSYLLRPRGLLTQVLCSAVDPRRITCIAVGVAALVMGSRLSAVQWTGVKVLLLAEAIVCGCALAALLLRSGAVARLSPPNFNFRAGIRCIILFVGFSLLFLPDAL